MLQFAEIYIRVQEPNKSGKEISNSALLEVRLRMFIIAQCPVYVGFVQMSDYYNSVVILLPRSKSTV